MLFGKSQKDIHVLVSTDLQTDILRNDYYKTDLYFLTNN